MMIHTYVRRHHHHHYYLHNNCCKPSYHYYFSIISIYLYLYVLYIFTTEEIEKIKLETLKQNQELQDMNKPDEKKIIFAKRNSKNIDAKLVHEVAILDSSYHTSGDEDMDSD